MLRRMIGPIVIGVFGCAVLIGLGTWQIQRLDWKEGVLAEMEARLHGPPAALPSEPDPARDRFRAFSARGTITGEGVFVMASAAGQGAGYRLIAAFETEAETEAESAAGGRAPPRRILIDRGFIPAGLRDAPRPAVEGVTITGNLHWPEDANSSTPAPDPAARLWFARELEQIAEFLDTEPLLVVLRDSTESAPPARFVPLDTAAVPNNHLNYAITWFSLAAVWAGMTGYLLWRIRQQSVRRNPAS